MTGTNKSIVVLQKWPQLAQIPLKNNLENEVFLQTKEFLTLVQLQVLTAPPLYTATVLSGVPNSLPSGNPVLQISSLKGEIFINQIPGDIYIYDYTNRLFMSSGEVAHDIVVDLQRLLRNQNKKLLKISDLCWT